MVKEEVTHIPPAYWLLCCNNITCSWLSTNSSTRRFFWMVQLVFLSTFSCRNVVRALLWKEYLEGPCNRQCPPPLKKGGKEAAFIAFWILVLKKWCSTKTTRNGAIPTAPTLDHLAVSINHFVKCYARIIPDGIQNKSR